MPRTSTVVDGTVVPCRAILGTRNVLESGSVGLDAMQCDCGFRFLQELPCDTVIRAACSVLTATNVIVTINAL